MDKKDILENSKYKPAIDMIASSKFDEILRRPNLVELSTKYTCG